MFYVFICIYLTSKLYSISKVPCQHHLLLLLGEQRYLLLRSTLLVFFLLSLPFAGSFFDLFCLLLFAPRFCERAPGLVGCVHAPNPVPRLKAAMGSVSCVRIIRDIEGTLSAPPTNLRGGHSDSESGFSW